LVTPAAPFLAPSALTAHVDETEADPITAIDLGTVTRLAVSEYDESGTAFERSLAYFDVPTAGAGTEGTNYDSTAYGSDDQWPAPRKLIQAQ
jgi:hypothetical protein